MASRKEEKERLRKAREEAERREKAAMRRRLWVGYGVAGVLAAAVLVGIVAVAIGGGDGNGGGVDDSPNVNEQFGVVPDGAEIDNREGTEPPPISERDLEAAAREAGCRLRTDLPDEGNRHFTDDGNDPGWETNPPTSGDHYGSNTETSSGALADGAYANMPPLSRAVHALEHGRIVIHYNPDLPERDQLAIKGVFDASRAGTILMPNSEMPDDVAAASWRQLLSCPSYEGEATLDALQDFQTEFRGRGPENIPF